MTTHDSGLPKKRVLTLPPVYEKSIATALATLGYSFEKPKALADAVLKLSDYYLANPEGETPWREPWAQAASLAYYFPLNFARNASVAREGARLGFFEGLTSLVDFGSGTGSAQLAWAHMGFEPGHSFALDVSPEALALHRILGEAASQSRIEGLLTDLQGERPRGLRAEPHNSVLTASYSLTELRSLPKWWLDYEALAIVEPSTREDGRGLMQTRKELIEAGYFIWAPCTHAENCPLLVNSEKDWCHDRIHWQAPAWMLEIERHLPMKNRTLTYSYLLARKSKPAPKRLATLARLVGDTLLEKGKSRQAVCRSQEREFLAWFPQRMKLKDELTFERGNLVRLDESLEKKSSEIRLPAATSLEEIAPEQNLADESRD